VLFRAFFLEYRLTVFAVSAISNDNATKELDMKIQIRASDIVRRDPVARELHTAQFRKRVVTLKNKYNRNAKHKKSAQD